MCRIARGPLPLGSEVQTPPGRFARPDRMTGSPLKAEVGEQGWSRHLSQTGRRGRCCPACASGRCSGASARVSVDGKLRLKHLKTNPPTQATRQLSKIQTISGVSGRCSYRVRSGTFCTGNEPPSGPKHFSVTRNNAGRIASAISRLSRYAYSLNTFRSHRMPLILCVEPGLNSVIPMLILFSYISPTPNFIQKVYPIPPKPTLPEILSPASKPCKVRPMQG